MYSLVRLFNRRGGGSDGDDDDDSDDDDDDRLRGPGLEAS